MTTEKGTKESPWKLKTPPLTSDYEMYKDVKDGKEILVCTVGKTVLHYDFRSIKDLHEMLTKHGDWMDLGSAEKGLRGRFGMYLPPLMEALGLAEVEHNPRNNRMRAV